MNSCDFEEGYLEAESLSGVGAFDPISAVANVASSVIGLGTTWIAGDMQKDLLKQQAANVKVQANLAAAETKRQAAAQAALLAQQQGIAEEQMAYNAAQTDYWKEILLYGGGVVLAGAFALAIFYSIRKKA